MVPSSRLKSKSRPGHHGRRNDGARDGERATDERVDGESAKRQKVHRINKVAPLRHGRNPHNRVSKDFGAYLKRRRDHPERGAKKRNQHQRHDNLEHDEPEAVDKLLP